MKNILYSLTLVIILFFTTPTTFARDTTGLFMSFQINDDDAYQKWRNITSPIFQTHQCKPFREGNIMAAKGSLQWNKAGHFSVLACQSPILAELETNGHFSRLQSIVDNLSLVEGELILSQNASPTTSAEYIIKISYFNNLNTSVRDKALMNIERQAQLTTDAWLGDAVLKPTSSLGLIRPDEFTFLYYPKAGQGKIFRGNNPAIMKKIGLFNQDHVERFIYLEGQLKNNKDLH